MRVVTLTLLIIAAISLSLPCRAAQADTSAAYAYVDGGTTVYFCSEPDMRKSLFAIPQTYCVQILSDYNGEWYYAKYADDVGDYIAVYGYVQKCDVILTDEPPEQLYLYMTVRIFYSAGGVDGMTALPEIEMTAAFYGSYEAGGSQCSYLYCNGAFGYYPQSYSYELNPLPSAPAFSETNENGNSGLITALAITAIAVAAVAILYFSGKRRPPTSDNSR